MLKFKLIFVEEQLGCEDNRFEKIVNAQNWAAAIELATGIEAELNHESDMKTGGVVNFRLWIISVDGEADA